MVPHFHFDVAWYGTEHAFAERGANVLAKHVRMADTDPSFAFIVDQVPLLEALRSKHPEAYDRLVDLVAEGRVEISGAFHVQAYEAVLGAESIARQLGHGQRYFLDNFGVTSTGLWNIDVSMYFRTYPGILAQAGVTHGFRGWGLAFGGGVDVAPSDIVWRGPDGAELLMHRNVGMDYLPWHEPIVSYGDAFIGRECPVDRAREQEALETTFSTLGEAAPSPVLMGLDGDDFSDPPCAATAVAQAWNAAFPERPVHISTASEFFTALVPHVANLPRPPAWANIGLWGTGRTPNPFSTARMSVKMANRRAEQALDRAERMAALATFASGPNATAPLYAAWERILPNQDHNIVTGSSIDAEYAIVHERYRAASDDAARITAESSERIAASIRTRGGPEGASAAIVVFNVVADERRDIASASIAFDEGVATFAIVDEEGRQLRHQIVSSVPCGAKLCGADVVFPIDVPSLGWRTVWVVPDLAPSVDPRESESTGPGATFENAFYTAALDEAGHLASLRERESGRELVGSSGRDPHVAFRVAHAHVDGRDVAFPDGGLPIDHVVVALDGERSLTGVEILRAAGILAMVAETPDERFATIDLSAHFDCDIASFDADRTDLSSLAKEHRVGLPADELRSTIDCPNDSLSFQLGSAAPGAKNALCAATGWTPGAATTVPLRRRYARLHILAVGLATVALVPTYEDGEASIALEFPPLPRRDAAKGDLTAALEALPDVANQWLVIADEGHTQDMKLGAITETSASHPATVAVVEGPVMTRVVARSTIGGMTFSRETRFFADHPRIEFSGGVDWTGSRAMLAAYFPIAVDTAGSTHGIPFGRDVRPNGFWPALGFRDVSDRRSGAAILDRGLAESGTFNGRTVLPLLRSTPHLFAPNENPGSFDRGSHTFEYAIVPHGANVVPETHADAFAQPLFTVGTRIHEGPMPARASLASFDAALSVTSVARDGDDLVLRFYERTGHARKAEIVTSGDATDIRRVDLLDRTRATFPDGDRVSIALAPTELATLRMRLAADGSTGVDSDAEDNEPRCGCTHSSRVPRPTTSWAWLMLWAAARRARRRSTSTGDD